MKQPHKLKHTSDKKIKDDTYWHSGFFGAIQLEFVNYNDSLSFINEHQLSKEALIMDAIIINKRSSVKIEKNIGKIFRDHNIFEYKSVTDYISIEDFYKIIAYGCLYKAFSSVIDIDDITISFVSYKKPVKLFKHLQKQWGISLRPVYDGIYYMQEGVLPIQFIVNNELPKEENIFLWSLRNNLSVNELEKVIYQLDNIGKTDIKQAYINTIIHANLNQFREVIKMAKSGQTDLYPAITELFRYFYEEDKWVPDYIQKDITEAQEKVAELQKEAAESQRKAAESQRKAAESQRKAAESQEKLQIAAKQMLKDGFPVEKVIKYIDLPQETIEALNDEINQCTGNEQSMLN